MLTVSNVSVSRGSQDLLREVSFTVNAGRRTALIGPNGSGKSTPPGGGPGAPSGERRQRYVDAGRAYRRLPRPERQRFVRRLGGRTARRCRHSGAASGGCRGAAGGGARRRVGGSGLRRRAGSAGGSGLVVTRRAAPLGPGRPRPGNADRTAQRWAAAQAGPVPGARTSARLPDPRRADQPPRRRGARRPRGHPPGVPWRGAVRVPRPRFPGPGRNRGPGGGRPPRHHRPLCRQLFGLRRRA